MDSTGGIGMGAPGPADLFFTDAGTVQVLYGLLVTVTVVAFGVKLSVVSAESRFSLFRRRITYVDR